VKLVITNSVVNEHFAITNRFLGQIGHFSTQINSVITNPSCNELNCRSRAVRYNRVCLYFIAINHRTWETRIWWPVQIAAEKLNRFKNHCSYCLFFHGYNFLIRTATKLVQFLHALTQWFSTGVTRKTVCESSIFEFHVDSTSKQGCPDFINYLKRFRSITFINISF
jgi:hypothetical protein